MHAPLAGLSSLMEAVQHRRPTKQHAAISKFSLDHQAGTLLPNRCTGVAFSAVFWHWPVAEKMEVEIACGICWSVEAKCSQGLVVMAVLCEALC